jgi:hypothetical protein
MEAAAFEGRWRIARRIEDRTGGPQGRFAGVGRFAPAGGGLDYAEEGELRLGEAAFAASRAYRWVCRAGGVDVLFGDGRFFHGFDWAAAVAEHPCGADLYRVRYDFGRWPDWAAVWEVRGPRKDYVMRSDYRREG